MSEIDRLVPLLASQQQALTRLLELAREERSCLLEGHLDRLTEIVQEQTTLLTDHGRLSKQITSSLERIAAARQLSGRVSLARIIPCVDDKRASQVRLYYRALTSAADELQRESRVNWYLAQQALKYVDFTLKFIGQAKDGPLPYAPPQQSGQPRAVQLLMDSCA
ncbi:MAG TPA: flagellar protein FlgN [Armatimonadota bacterium]|jgi:flagellar biosynthesis/type III secretory pathway chaperone